MATKVNVKRLDLIAAIEEKAEANKKAEAARLKELGKKAGLSAAIEQAIEDDFAKIPAGNYNTHGGGYQKASVIGYANSLLISLGLPQIKPTTSTKSVRDMSGELAILKMSTDETLALDDTSDYFSFLKT